MSTQELSKAIDSMSPAYLSRLTGILSLDLKTQLDAWLKAHVLTVNTVGAALKAFVADQY